jgi:Icc-related predicted phosphoesterase
LPPHRTRQLICSIVTACVFASDLHGRLDRYEKLFGVVEAERPDAVFMGGDLLPSEPVLRRPPSLTSGDFVNGFLVRKLGSLKARLGSAYPEVFVILGNDDPRAEEAAILDAAATGIWTYVHNSRRGLGSYVVYGYAYVPPTPFVLKDWERYDVSRYVDPGCVAPTEGHISFPVSRSELEWSTIKGDLDDLTGDGDLSSAVFLFHSPPYNTKLDRAALDGRKVDHVPLDVHVGSIAIERFIETRQPLLTLHGHVHESARLTGEWRERIGRTHAFTAAHDGPELALVRFTLEDLSSATRELI